MARARSQSNTKSMTIKRRDAKFRLLLLLLFLLLLLGALRLYRLRHQLLAQFPGLRRTPVLNRVLSRKTVAEAISEYGAEARGRLQSDFAKAGLKYPPAKLTLLGLKAEATLQVYATDESGNYKYVRSYPIIGTSGVLGPKLAEGDRQMPEGLYCIQELEPNTPYHLAMRVNYPNDFDRAMGKADNRTSLGGDIMIHGSKGSIGCLAMGDPASEDLFVLVHDVGLKSTNLLMSPYDFRNPPRGVELPVTPGWTSTLYSSLKKEVEALHVDPLHVDALHQ